MFVCIQSNLHMYWDSAAASLHYTGLHSTCNYSHWVLSMGSHSNLIYALIWMRIPSKLLITWFHVSCNQALILTCKWWTSTLHCDTMQTKNSKKDNTSYFFFSKIRPNQKELFTRQDLIGWLDPEMFKWVIF